MSQAEPGDACPEPRRRAMFRALVEAQDQGTTVAASRALVAEKFGVEAFRVLDIEREGIAENWPPLNED